MRLLTRISGALLRVSLAVGFCSALSAEVPEDAAERVIVLANSRSAESLRLAEYYVAKRGIPKENIIALPMTQSLAIKWPAFIQTVFQPLQDVLVERNWIDAVPSEARDSIGRRRIAVSGHRISYLVVCRGVPLKLEHYPAFYAPFPPVTDRAEFRTTQSAVDAELCLVAAPSYPISGLVGNPLYGKERPTQFDHARVIKVSRLDGPTLDDARALVDSAMTAERDGLIGRAYVDIGGPHGTGDKWFQKTAELLEGAYFDTIVDREKKTFPQTARFDRPALYFGWYAWNVNGPFLQKGFKFPPGAVALHLHSYSARSLAKPDYGWTAPLVARGAAATVGNVYEPYLDFTHQPQLLLQALLQGKTWGEAVYFSLRGLSWQAIAIGDPLYRPMARSLADQWAERASLTAEQFGYVVIRQIRALQDGGRQAEAFELARDSMKERPSTVLALEVVALARAQGDTETSLEASRWVVEHGSDAPTDLPLLISGLEIVLASGEASPAAARVEGALTSLEPTAYLRSTLLKRCADAARTGELFELADKWAAELAAVTALRTAEEEARKKQKAQTKSAPSK